jgi:hypothetical protein
MMRHPIVILKDHKLTMKKKIYLYRVRVIFLLEKKSKVITIMKVKVFPKRTLMITQPE